MKPSCEYCGYDFEHDPKVCRSLLAERKQKITVSKKGNVANISRKGVLQLAEYLNKKRV